MYNSILVINSNVNCKYEGMESTAMFVLKRLLCHFEQILIALVVGWLVSMILTETGYYDHATNTTVKEYYARTDVRRYVIDRASWFYFPYPGKVKYMYLYFKTDWLKTEKCSIHNKTVYVVLHKLVQMRLWNIDASAEAKSELAILRIEGQVKNNTNHPLSNNSHPLATANKAKCCLKWGGVQNHLKHHILLLKYEAGHQGNKTFS